MATEEKILERVQKLLALAEHPNTPEAEAELALAQANSLINKHAIDEALLRMSQTLEQRRAPEKRRIVVASGTGMGIALSALRSILHDMARTYRCSIAIDGAYNADIYGASEDVAWVEMLFMSTYYQLLLKINPKWDTEKSYDENVYNFKVAGFAWADIDKTSREHGGPDARVWEAHRGMVQDVRDYEANPDEQTPIWEPKYAWSASNFRNVTIAEEEDLTGRFIYGDWEQPHPTKIKGSMISAYRRWAKEIGDDQPVATASHHAYRIYFIEGFKHRMFSRLIEYRSEMDRNMDSIPGAALAIRDMTEEAKQMMYGDHPDMDPEEQERMRREAVEAEAAKLEAMSPSERTVYLEAQEREERRRNKPRKVKYLTYDESAVLRGKSAADGVNMNRNAGAAEATRVRGELA